jgi:hypothetical protein
LEPASVQPLQLSAYLEQLASSAAQAVLRLLQLEAF